MASIPSAPEGGKVVVKNAKAVEVPKKPVIVSIIGDGIGSDIFPAMQKIVETAVETCGGGRGVAWHPVPAGEMSIAAGDPPLPDETVAEIAKWGVAIKGPLTTPVGGGIRSLNVALRQRLDLYACVRPVRHFKGVPSPVKAPEKLDVVIFRENTEDVYAGIEWEAGSPEATKVRQFLMDEFGCKIRERSAIGIKPMSEVGSKQLIRAAIRYAIDRKRRSVTLVHKGNIMKFTEGAFRDWGYELAREEFGDVTVAENDLDWSKPNPEPEDKIVIRDRIADSMFQQILTRSAMYDVIATPNLNGDYLSDACAAQVGGLGMAPGANIGADAAVFEATHGSAPKYAGKNVVNPCSLVLSAGMMLEFLGWKDAAEKLHASVETTISSGVVTQDLARLMPDTKPVGTAEFAEAVCKAIKNGKS
jgi:isocitrate dehydrogenase